MPTLTRGRAHAHAHARAAIRVQAPISPSHTSHRCTVLWVLQIYVVDQLLLNKVENRRVRPLFHAQRLRLDFGGRQRGRASPGADVAGFIRVHASGAAPLWRPTSWGNAGLRSSVRVLTDPNEAAARRCRSLQRIRLHRGFPLPLESPWSTLEYPWSTPRMRLECPKVLLGVLLEGSVGSAAMGRRQVWLPLYASQGCA